MDFNLNLSTYGSTTLLDQIRTRINGPHEIIEYSNLVLSSYPQVSISTEPFIGLRILLRDTRAFNQSPHDRIMSLEAELRDTPQRAGLLKNKGCILRETVYDKMKDGLWLITLPVPRSHLNHQIQNTIEVLNNLEYYFGIITQDLIDINISGRCPVWNMERAMSSIIIPSEYKPMQLTADNSPYQLGYVTRINDEFCILRSRYMISKNEMFDKILTIVSLIAPNMHQQIYQPPQTLTYQTNQTPTFNQSSWVG